MAIGSRQTTTVTFFIPAKQRVQFAGVPIPTATGFIPMPAGLGFPKSRLDGRPITTAVGRGWAESVGFGSRAASGRRPWFHGARATIMWVGRRSLPKLVSINAPAFEIGQTVIMKSARTNIVLSPAASSVHRELSKLSFRLNATSRSSIKRPTSRTSPIITRRSLTKVQVTMSCEQLVVSPSNDFDWSETRT